MLEAGADVNRPSAGLYSHGTPLHHAVCSGSLATVRVLVEAGAGTAKRDTAWNGTPLGWAEHDLSERKDDDSQRHYGEIAEVPSYPLSAFMPQPEPRPAAEGERGPVIFGARVFRGRTLASELTTIIERWFRFGQNLVDLPSQQIADLLIIWIQGFIIFSGVWMHLPPSRDFADLFGRHDGFPHLQIEPSPRRVAVNRIRPRNPTGGKPHRIVRKTPIGLGIVGAHELSAASEGLFTLSYVILARLHCIGVRPGSYQKSLADELFDPFKISDRVVDLEPGGSRVFGSNRSKHDAIP